MLLRVGSSGGRSHASAAAARAAAAAAAATGGRRRLLRLGAGSIDGAGTRGCCGCGSSSSSEGQEPDLDHEHQHQHQYRTGAEASSRTRPLTAAAAAAAGRSAGPLVAPPLASLPLGAESGHQPQPQRGGQRRMSSTSTNFLHAVPASNTGLGGGGLPGQTFVSKYYRMELGDVLEFLRRKDLAFRETATHVLIKECPFCPKPTLGRADNEWKLYVSKDGGAWFCHRCGEKGSWFDFKRRMGSNLLPPAPSSDAEAWGLFTSDTHSSPAMLQSSSLRAPQTRYGGRAAMQRPSQQQPSLPAKDLTAAVKEYQYALMDDPKHRHAREWLTGDGEGQRGLNPTVLRKYGVGCATFSFLNAHNQSEPAECVVFPWMVEAPASSSSSSSVKTATAAAAADAPASVVGGRRRRTRGLKSAGAVEGEEGGGQKRWVTKRCKIRAIKEKAWQRLHPTGAGWGLFGLHTVGAEATEVVLTEGEFDAMAVYQATGRPAVSLPNGCRSLPVEVLPLLERFERISLWMDADQPGVEGAEKFAHKLGVTRTFIVRPLPDEPDPPKDANEALLRGIDMERMLQRAERLPDNRIVRFADLRPLVFDGLRNPDKYEGVRSRAFPGLTSLLKGFRKGEMTVLTGPTGAGKTTFLSQLSIDLAANGLNTLWGSFEVQNTRLVEKMLRQYHAAPLPMGDAKGLDAVADRFARLPLLFMRFHGSTHLDEVMDAMEYCAYVYDTGLVILDNLQFMTAMASSASASSSSGQSSSQQPYRSFSGFDRFHQMDVAVERFRRFATEKNVHVLLVVHPRKESDQLRLGISSISGTAKATQDADNVLILQRHQGRHYLDLKKNRFDGDLGIVPLEFRRDTGTLKEVENPRLASALVHEDMHGPSIHARYGGQGGGDPRNQPLVKERQFY